MLASCAEQSYDGSVGRQAFTCRHTHFQHAGALRDAVSELF
jgi:hypothetical protein